MRAKRKYDPEFKREAVRLVVEEGLRIREVERNLGITHGVLKDWVRKHRDHKDAAQVGPLGPQSSDAELKQLRRKQMRSLRSLCVQTGCYIPIQSCINAAER